MGDVSRCDHALVASRLYLPKEWAKDRKRRKRGGVPKEIRFQTRHELALGMLKEQGHLLPHQWIAGVFHCLNQNGPGSTCVTARRGPLVLEIVKRRVLARTERSGENLAEELWVVTRYKERGGTIKYD